MRAVVAVFDDVFENADVVQSDIFSGEFKDIVNPIDGVTYPGINSEIPGYITSHVVNRLSEIMGAFAQPVAIFARMTSKALAPAPHKIHSDKIMGQYSAHIYLSSEWPDGAGTSFWAHDSEGYLHTEETNEAKIIADQNNLERWKMSFNVQGVFNRMLIHDARYWHCAEPVGGWGFTSGDSRVVLTCFFNVEGAK